MTIGNQAPNQGVFWGNLSPNDSPMRSHIQGLFVLLGVGIAVLVLARIAAPVLSDAFGDEGAIVAESADVDDVVNLAAADAELEVALTGDEIAQLQADLTNLGFDPGPIDGILGNGTRAAIDAAIAEYQLDTAASDRDVLDYVTALLNAVAAAEAADNPANDLSVESQGEVESGASADG